VWQQNETKKKTELRTPGPFARTQFQSHRETIASKRGIYLGGTAVHEKMRLEVLVETQIGILDGRSSFFSSNKPFEKRPWMSIEDFGLHSGDPEFWRRSQDKGEED